MFTYLLSLVDALAQQPVLVTLVMGAAALGESALGVGTLVPGETLVAVGAHNLDGRSVLWLAWVVVAAAAFVGDHVGYLVGRRVGPALAASALVRRIGVRRWRRATEVLERYGVLMLVAGRLVPGVRTLLAPAAGALGMSYRRYAPAAAAAALLWSALWVGGGATVVRMVLAVSPAVALSVGGALAVVVAAVLAARHAPSGRHPQRVGAGR